jgi:hypothetical protein
MNFIFELAHRDAVIGKLHGGIGWTWTVSRGLRNLGNRQRIDELRERNSVQLRAKFRRGLVRHGLGHGRSNGRNPRRVSDKPHSSLIARLRKDRMKKDQMKIFA